LGIRKVDVKIIKEENEDKKEREKNRKEGRNKQF